MNLKFYKKYFRLFLGITVVFISATVFLITLGNIAIDLLFCSIFMGGCTYLFYNGMNKKINDNKKQFKKENNNDNEIFNEIKVTKYSKINRIKHENDECIVKKKIRK